MRIVYGGKTYKVTKPCPFCGSMKLEMDWHYYAKVECTACLTRGPVGMNPDEAVLKWEERA